MSYLPDLGVRIQIVPSNAHDCALSLARLNPLGPHHRDIHLNRLFPQRTPALRAHKVSRVDANGVDELAADPVEGGRELLFLLRRHYSRCDRDPRQICHLVGAAHELLGLIRPGGCAQDQVEGIFGVDGKAADLRAQHLQGPRDRASFRAIAIEGKRLEGGRRQVDRIPL